MMYRAHAALDRLAMWGPVRRHLQARYEQRFAQNQRSNLFRGVYGSFQEALASAPPTRPHGYDNEASAALYDERMRRLYATDYPVLYWLQRLFAQGVDRVFDLGGHVGVSYYAYQPFLQPPPGLRWRVHDVPAVMARGHRLAEQHDAARRLEFAERVEALDGEPLLMALGSLQYLPQTLADLLAGLKAPPPHLLLNLLPLHDSQAFFTLQSVGTAFCPYRIGARPAFVQSLQALGYECVDEWENPEKRCEIPFHPGHSLDHYHGFYFRRRG